MSESEYRYTLNYELETGELLRLGEKMSDRCKWISVKDTLPDISKNTPGLEWLVLEKFRGVYPCSQYVARYTGSQWITLDPWGNTASLSVTHYMPLPEPPDLNKEN